MANYSIGQLRGAFAAGKRAAEEATTAPNKNARADRAMAFVKRELLKLVSYAGLDNAFQKDGGTQEHWPRCLACEFLRSHDDDDLRDLLFWIRDELDRIHGKDLEGAVEQAATRLELRWLEYLDDRRRTQTTD